MESKQNLGVLSGMAPKNNILKVSHPSLNPNMKVGAVGADLSTSKISSLPIFP